MSGIMQILKLARKKKLPLNILSTIRFFFFKYSHTKIEGNNFYNLSLKKKVNALIFRQF